jgi:ribosomal protein S18 acetylase RimI-like enzyme
MGNGMENLVIRPVTLADLSSLAEIDHSYHTDYAWQMDLNTRELELLVSFREVRLPRSMRVEYPRDLSHLIDGVKDRPGFLVAELDGEAIGYVNLSRGNNSDLIRVIDFVVNRRLRRYGIGVTLIRAAQTWATQENATHLILEMQSKNHPTICLANKLGFEFCGYNDHYYANQDIALFFVKRV